MARLTIAKAYERVNETWPASVPPMTADEAVRAAKRLYRFAMHETWTGPVHVTSGVRYSTLDWRAGKTGGFDLTLIVNPEHGWKKAIHTLSHAFYYRANPGEKPHSKDHARLERQMIAEVVRRGWLEGKLRSKSKPEPEPSKLDRKESALAKLDLRIQNWERKAKRAATALKRLHSSRRVIVRSIEKEKNHE
jgi:hypothetical protein